MKQVAIALMVLLAGCSYFKKKDAPDGSVIARVNEEYLYGGELKALTKGLKPEDSVQVLKNFAEGWVRKKLLLQKALDNIPDDDVSIARKMQDYREELVLYEYEKALINKRLDTVVRSEELNDWYEKRKTDFPLDDDVYLLFFIKLKADAPELGEARKWIMKPKDEEDLRKLEGYCKQFATSYVMETGMWYEKEKVLKNFPLSEYDINTLVGSKNFREYKTDDGLWFIRIADVLKKGDPSPVEFMKDKIVKAIIEKRRLMLIEKTYDKIYQDGLKSKAFEVYVK